MTEPLRQQSPLEVSASRRGPGRSGIPLVILGLCAAGFAVAGYALYLGFSALQRRIETLETSVKASVDSRVSLTAKLEEIFESQRRIEAAIARLEASSQSAPHSESRPNLSASDLELLRSFFRLTRTEGVLPNFKLGDLAASTELRAMPEFVAEKISAALRGTRFLFDRNGSLVITAGPNNEVIAIVPP